MADSKAKFPAPESSDPDDVVLALETANALWGRGDAREAIRWLRRAAEAAEEAGDDMRSLRLARTAADITTQLDSEGASAGPARPSTLSATPPPKPVSIPPAKPVAAAAKPETATTSSPAAAATPEKPAPAATPAAASSPRAAAASAPRASTPPPVTSSSPATTSMDSESAAPPPPPPPPASSASAALVAARSAHRVAAEMDQAPLSSDGDRGKDALAQLAALASADASSSTTPRARRALGPYQALRVSVEPSKNDRKEMLVRVLNQNEQAPESGYEALLVAMHPNQDMRSRRKA